MQLADPNCPHCGGEGQIWDDTDTIVPISGRACVCVLRAAARLEAVHRLEAARLPERYREASVDAFNLREGVVMVTDRARGTRQQVSLAEIDGANRDRVRELISRPLSGGETVAFTGPFGAGKTYLASALLRAQILQHGKSGLYLTVVEYLRRLRPDEAEPEEQRELRRLAQEVDILLLDDLGNEKDSAYVARELWELINHRTANKKAHIITSNMTINQALQYSRDTKSLPAEQRESAENRQRIYSRLAETRVAPLVWPEGTRDYRLERPAAPKSAASSEERARLRQVHLDQVAGSDLSDLDNEEPEG